MPSFSEARWNICISYVSEVSSLYTVTGFVCPMRWQRALKTMTDDGGGGGGGGGGVVTTGGNNTSERRAHHQLLRAEPRAHAISRHSLTHSLVAMLFFAAAKQTVRSKAHDTTERGAAGLLPRVRPAAGRVPTAVALLPCPASQHPLSMNAKRRTTQRTCACRSF
jgi:hypothetical protein